MNNTGTKTMRDALIGNIYKEMQHNDRIFFLSADMGAPALDEVRREFGDRFINVGIAEQNLINVATGLALEGFVVYAYAIAGFLTMRAYEQIRTNLALFSQQKAVNVNLIGVGTGVSYDLSGPSHHCLEDISIIRTLPNIVLCSPADWVTAEKFVPFSINTKKPKYIRLDSKPLPQIYDENKVPDWEKGFCELVKGDDICIVSTGYMTHRALRIANELEGREKNVGVVDIFLLNPMNEELFFNVLSKYRRVVTIEEAFVGKGGLDSLISGILRRRKANIKLKSFGFGDKYIFKTGGRDFLSELSCFADRDIIKVIEESGI
jgi:transketolase